MFSFRKKKEPEVTANVQEVSKVEDALTKALAEHAAKQAEKVPQEDKQKYREATRSDLTIGALHQVVGSCTPEYLDLLDKAVEVFKPPEPPPVEPLDVTTIIKVLRKEPTMTLIEQLKLQIKARRDGLTKAEKQRQQELEELEERKKMFKALTGAQMAEFRAEAAKLDPKLAELRRPESTTFSLVLPITITCDLDTQTSSADSMTAALFHESSIDGVDELAMYTDVKFELGKDAQIPDELFDFVTSIINYLNSSLDLESDQHPKHKELEKLYEEYDKLNDRLVAFMNEHDLSSDDVEMFKDPLHVINEEEYLQG